MAEKKESLLGCLKILEKYSDEEHPLSATQIQKYLKDEYDIEIERRTVYANLEALRNYDYDISNYQDNHQGYYLMNRTFEESEIILLANAIHASKSVSPNHTKDLIKRLLMTQGENYYKKKKELYWKDNHKLHDNEFFFRIEMINNAIYQQNCIEFDYMHFDLNKNLIQRRDTKYRLHPYKIVYSDEKSYLVAKSDNHLGEFEFSNYRIDKIRNCRIIKKRVNPLTSQERDMLEQYSQDRPYMFSGTFIRATLRCDYSILDQVIDTFGASVSLSPDINQKFLARITATENEIMIFSFQYARNIELLDPLSLRDEYIKQVKELLGKY